jgi:hypothetical protein
MWQDIATSLDAAMIFMHDPASQRVSRDMTVSFVASLLMPQAIGVLTVGIISSMIPRPVGTKTTHSVKALPAMQ